MDEIEELLSGFWIISKNSQHCGCYGFAINLLHAPHHHAHMPETLRSIHYKSFHLNVSNAPGKLYNVILYKIILTLLRRPLPLLQVVLL